MWGKHSRRWSQRRKKKQLPDFLVWMRGLHRGLNEETRETDLAGKGLTISDSNRPWKIGRPWKDKDHRRLWWPLCSRGEPELALGADHVGVVCVSFELTEDNVSNYFELSEACGVDSQGGQPRDHTIAWPVHTHKQESEISHVHYDESGFPLSTYFTFLLVEDF